MNVLLVGLPRSGNRLIGRLLKYHGVNFLGVRHFGSGYPSPPEVDLAILPVRDPEINWKAMKVAQRGLSLSNRDRIQTPQDLHYKHFAATLQNLHCVPILPISYEALVDDPELVGKAIVESCGAEWKGWPEAVTDGNSKYKKWVVPNF